MPHFLGAPRRRCPHNPAGPLTHQVPTAMPSKDVKEAHRIFKELDTAKCTDKEPWRKAVGDLYLKVRSDP